MLCIGVVYFMLPICMRVNWSIFVLDDSVTIYFMENFEQSSPTVNQALQELHAVRGMLQAEGNVDAEPDMLNTIQRELENGDITPAEAIYRVRHIQAERIQR